MANKNDDVSIQKLTNAMDSLNNYLKGNGDELDSLKANWIFLQIFSTYGLRLPNTAAALQTTLKLNADQAAGFTWFDSMYGSYNMLNEASNYFFNDVFDEMTTLGNGLKSYASDAAGEDSVFSLISSLVKPTDGSKPDLEAALSILADLRTTSQANADRAGTIKKNLQSYKSKLVNAQSKMKTVKTAVDQDDATSQATIDKLEGGKDVKGSLAQLKKMMKKNQKQYKHDVVVASTSVTYAWVIPPIGLIAASSVAGIYAKRATDMLDTINKLEGLISKAEHKLQLAIATHNTVKLADSSLSQVMQYTDEAIDKTTIIQNSWNNMTAGLDYIADKVKSSLKEEHGKEKLANVTAVAYFMKQAQKEWTKIQPTIDLMVSDPYITVAPGTLTMSQFGQEVVDEADKLTNPSTETA